jgi:arginine/lysine/ornithine decarboxylase
MPGEQITAELLEYLRELIGLGVKIVGPQDLHMGRIQVIA